MLLNSNQSNLINEEFNTNYDSFPRIRSITGFVREKFNEINSVKFFFLINFIILFYFY